MTDNRFFRQSQLLKLFSNPLNVSILYLLRHGRTCVNDLVRETKEVQPYVSKQLGILYKYKLVSRVKVKVTVYYYLRNKNVIPLLDMIHERVKQLEMEQNQALEKGLHRDDFKHEVVI